jgi:hypothetical protein
MLCTPQAELERVQLRNEESLVAWAAAALLKSLAFSHVLHVRFRPSIILYFARWCSRTKLHGAAALSPQIADLICASLK